MIDLDYRGVFEEFNRSGIDYLVVGGLAVNFHGVPRMTYDVDIMILMDSANILKCVEKLTSWGYKPKIPVDPKDLASEEKRKAWVFEKGRKAFNFYNEKLPIAEIDLVIESSVPYEKLKSNAVRINLRGVMAPTVSISDLIEMKRGAGRKQDLVDIEYLRKILER